MVWINPRSTHRPGSWAKIRKRVLRRDDYKCQIQGPGCTVLATEADHIVPNDDHSPENLQSVCHPCHREKTKLEAKLGMEARRKRGLRPQPKHPGSI